jgi:peptidyl-tRNA hydrolase
MSSASATSSSGTATSLCAFAAGASLGAAATLVYAKRHLGSALPQVAADSRAAPLLSEIVSRLPPSAREYLPFSLDRYYDRRRREGAAGAAAVVLDEGAAPATPTHGEAAAAAPAAEDDGGANDNNNTATATTPPPQPQPARQPSDLLLPLALTQRTDTPPGGAADRVRSVPLSSLGDLSESSALATPRGGDRGPPPSPPLRRAAVTAAAAQAAAKEAAAQAAGGAEAAKPPRPASSGSGGTNKGQQQQQQSSRPSTSPPPPSEYKLALVVRGDLRWARQKTAVMCSHASVAAWKKAWKAAGARGTSSAGGGSSAGADPSALAKWEREKSPKVVLKADDENALDGLLELAKKAGLPTHAMSELAGAAAATEGGGGGPQKSRVILAIGPAPSDAINAVVGDLKLV